MSAIYCLPSIIASPDIVYLRTAPTLIHPFNNQHYVTKAPFFYYYFCCYNHRPSLVLCIDKSTFSYNVSLAQILPILFKSLFATGCSLSDVYNTNYQEFVISLGMTG